MRILFKILFAFLVASWCALAIDLLFAWLQNGMSAVPLRLLHVAGSPSVWSEPSWRHVWIALGELALINAASGFGWRRAEGREAHLTARGGG